MKVFTVRQNFQPTSFGYETSQSYRHRLLDSLSVPNSFLVTSSFTSIFWWKRVEALGFNVDNDKFIVLPHLFSDLNNMIHSVTEEVFESSILPKLVDRLSPLISVTNSGTGKTYEYQACYFDTMCNDQGIVTRLIKRDKSLRVLEETILTDGLFYTDYKNGTFSYFNRDGSIALKGEAHTSSGRLTYTYWHGQHFNMKLSEADLITLYLKSHAVSGDLVINDQLQERFDSVTTFCKSNGIRYLDFLHYNKYYADSKGLLKNPKPVLSPSLVASPYIMSDLAKDGVKTVFAPPIAVKVQGTTPIGLISNKFILVGNFTKEKRVGMALEAFISLPDLELDIYGGTLQDYLRLYPDAIVPPNVRFLGSVPSNSIPYGDYLGYISCSETEMFANALVEALAFGLIPVISNVDYAHRRVASELDSPFIFNTTDELIDSLYHLYNSISVEDRLTFSKNILAYTESMFGEDVSRDIWVTILNDSSLTV